MEQPTWELWKKPSDRSPVSAHIMIRRGVTKHEVEKMMRKDMSIYGRKPDSPTYIVLLQNEKYKLNGPDKFPAAFGIHGRYFDSERADEAVSTAQSVHFQHNTGYTVTVSKLDESENRKQAQVANSRQTYGEFISRGAESRCDCLRCRRHTNFWDMDSPDPQAETDPNAIEFDGMQLPPLEDDPDFGRYDDELPPLEDDTSSANESLLDEPPELVSYPVRGNTAETLDVSSDFEEDQPVVQEPPNELPGYITNNPSFASTPIIEYMNLLRIMRGRDLSFVLPMHQIMISFIVYLLVRDLSRRR